ncbi:MAG: Jag N-terminal domain-containing protein [Candidatus Hydrogenedentes bacterium]|nr:Jag N-terminal domain-containing protein [Candidatus Hydrogenedentota bacterium]
MRSVEVTAKTREEAIKLALKQLRAERHEVNVEIVDEGSPGFFGFGARPVKLRVTHESDEPEAPAPHEPERRETPRRDGPRRGGEQRRDASRREAPRSDAPRSESPRSESPRREGNRHEQPRREGPRPEQPRRERDGNRAEQPRRERDGNRAEQPRKETPRQEQPRRESPRPPAEPLTPPSERFIAEAEALLRELIQKMGIEATVASEVTENGSLRLKVESPDSAILIGRKGRTLQSLQYLINRIAHSGEGNEDTERIVVDVEGYVDRRREALEDLARKLAQRVKETGRRVRVKPMSPDERRIIHLTLEDDPEVRTYSVGEASVRSVIIGLKDDAPNNDRSPRRRPDGQQRDGRGRRDNGGRRHPQGRRDSGHSRNQRDGRSVRPDNGNRADDNQEPVDGNRIDYEPESREGNRPSRRRRPRRRRGGGQRAGVEQQTQPSQGTADFDAGSSDSQDE